MLEKLLQNKVIPVAVLNGLEETKETLTCLKQGGINAIEITYRTAFAGEAIKYASENFPEILTGAGTVTTKAQAINAIKMGAKFIVGPGFSKDVAKVCRKKGVLYIPGVVTPTEIIMAKDQGLTFLKFFPFSNFGGEKTVKALAGPFPDVKFMITGGIDGSNFTDFLKIKNVVAIGGSWMLKGSTEEKLEKIQEINKKLEEM